MFQDLSMALKNVGLDGKDAAIYLICLHFNDGLYVHEIVEQTNFKRSTVDLVLKRLEQGRYVNKVKVGNRFKFFAQSPESVAFRQEQALDDFRAALPMLSSLKARKEQTEIRFFEGKKGIRDIHDDMLLKLKFATGDKRQVVSFVSGLDTQKIFPDMQTRFVEKRVDMGVWFRGVAPKSSASVSEYAKNNQELRDVKYVDDAKFPFKATIEAYADCVMIYSPTKPFGGVVIRNHKIADSMRSLFYLVWELLPDEQDHQAPT